VRDCAPHASSLQPRAEPTGQLVPAYTATFESVENEPQVSTAAVPLNVAVQRNHSSLLIAVCPKTEHKLSFCPCEPVLAYVLS
jgi:hypothetical protein